MKIDKPSAAVGAAVAAVALAVALPRIADAAGPSPSPSATNAPSSPGDHGRHFGAEAELTGGTADKVRAAVLAKLPGATISRLSVEDSREGTAAAYEAHVTKADGSRVEVLLDKNFAVTAVNEDRHGGFHGRSAPGGNGTGSSSNNGTSGSSDVTANDAGFYTA